MTDMYIQVTRFANIPARVQQASKTADMVHNRPMPTYFDCPQRAHVRIDMSAVAYGISTLVYSLLRATRLPSASMIPRIVSPYKIDY